MTGAGGSHPIKDLLRNTTDRALSYLTGLAGRSVLPTAEALARLTALDAPLSYGPGDPDDTIALLDDIGSPASVATAGPRLQRTG
jgi:hypothetical protein